MMNDEQKILRTNRSARAIFGQNLAGRHLREIIPNEELTDAVASVVEDLRGREVEFRIHEPVMRDFLSIIERFPIPSPGGMSIVITMNDITELKAVEQMRADFVANASHEIRTPLASIAGFIETLQGPAKDDEEAREEFLRLMAEQAERMKQLINDLLSLSKIEMNAHAIPTDPVDIVNIARQVTNQLQHHARPKNVTLHVEVAQDIPKVKGEENELAQVVHNLVGNAIKYGASDAEVTVLIQITSELPPDQNMRHYSRVVQVAVRDRGEGIAREHLSRLTERFYRVDSARSRAIGGTGLGLAIVKGIVARHRGAITIDSTVGKGSTFSVYLPIYEA
jgi:two-component system phosphate regulon sensor histidine kinase PhoR